EVWVMPVDDATENVHSTRLADGRVRVEMPVSLAGSATRHISCRNSRQPGWCYISGYAREGGNDTRDSKSMPWRSVVAVRLDGSGHAEKVAETRHAAGIS